jgi:hypothetical protein
VRLDSNEVMDELALAEPDLCQNCRFFKITETKIVCAHPEVNVKLNGVVQCGSKFFLQSKPWYAKAQ